MEFFIKKNATLPLLKLQVVKDGRSDYNNFMKLIEVASLYFSMVDTEMPNLNIIFIINLHQMILKMRVDMRVSL
jgi:hypothetical protein